ncbi:MAG: butyrate kinase [Ichthyobacteriaceae bacterium]|nr:butyrate kinase [Ichthyobacteriaceae bacterium]
MKYIILVINPGSTSTKIAIFENEKVLYSENIQHSIEELNSLKLNETEFDLRKTIIEEKIISANFSISDIHLIVARGGLLKPVESGIYEVNKKMITDLSMAERYHASNLGGLIADSFSGGKIKAYIADPVVVDEMEDIARFSGHPKFKRESVFHALNQKAVARAYADSIDLNYNILNLIVVHMGGGISVGVHKKGRVIDVNQALDGEGPFSPERSGSLPIGDVVKLAFSNVYTEDEIMKMIVGKGGLVAYMGSNNAYKISVDAENGDKKSKDVFEAMAYQISKEIGAMATVLNGNVDAIILTGGLANSKMLNNLITERVRYIADVEVFPGEDEMKALASNGLMLMQNKIIAKEYLG